MLSSIFATLPAPLYSTAGFTPSVTAVGGSLTLSALLGLVPLIAFFVMLGAFKIKTHWCALGSLALAIIIAVAGFRMPVLLTLSATVEGAAFGLFPILFIVIMAVWLYNLTEESGREKDVRALFSMVGKGDMRVQALLIGFCFCGLLEGLAGFGAPVAISCAMLLALGLPATKAALLTLIGNALNVGFGAMAIPVTTAARSGGENAALVGATMGRLTPFLLIWTPLIMVLVLDGKRGLKQTWPAGLIAGFGMAFGHFIAANFLSYELTAVFASLISFALLALFMRIWQPSTPPEQKSEQSDEKIGASRTILGLLPYWLVVAIFAVAKLWTWGVNIPVLLKSTDISFAWPGVYGELLNPDGTAAKGGIFTLSLFSSPGTMLLITCLVVSIVYGLNSSNGLFKTTIARGFLTLPRTIYTLRLAIVTICAVMSLAYVMNFSGQTVAIGTWLAATGAVFAIISPLLGWIGTAVTGSATSAGAIFANLQAAAAHKAGLSPVLLIGANEIGGGIGKIVSPQNLAIAATAIDEPGCEAELLRKALPWSIGLLLVLSGLVLLASLGPLSIVIA